MNSDKAVLITYQSKTGFTKKYVDWLAESVEAQVIPFDQFHTVNLNQYTTIVYGAGIYAGRIKGLTDFKKMVQNFPHQDIIVFATGGAPCTEEVLETVKQSNFSLEELIRISFFYFQSGLRYEKMGLGEKAMLKIYDAMLKLKTNKTESEQGASQTLGTSYDNTRRDYIKPLIDHIAEGNRC